MASSATSRRRSERYRAPAAAIPQPPNSALPPRAKLTSGAARPSHRFVTCRVILRGRARHRLASGRSPPRRRCRKARCFDGLERECKLQPRTLARCDDRAALSCRGPSFAAHAHRPSAEIENLPPAPPHARKHTALDKVLRCQHDGHVRDAQDVALGDRFARRRER